MKRFFVLLLPLLSAILTACSQWPKDAYIRDAKVSTPWGSSSAEIVATGKAAANLTEAERKEILTPTRK